MSWESRIVSEGDVDPGELLEHPENWRRHPQVQRAAMEGALNEVGWVQRVVVNQRTDRIIDGHLRVALARERGDETVPVVWVDLSHDEERVVLASMDTITSLAEADNQVLHDLLASLDVQDNGLAELVDTERLRVLSLLGDQDTSGGGGGSGDDSMTTFEVTLTHDDRRMVEETLSAVKHDHGLETQGDALVALCQSYREE